MRRFTGTELVAMPTLDTLHGSELKIEIRDGERGIHERVWFNDNSDENMPGGPYVVAETWVPDARDGHGAWESEQYEVEE